MVPERFETGRLVATRIAESDYAELCALHRDARVMATLSGVRSDAQTRAFLETSISHWATHGFGLWTWRTRAEGRFVGRAGIRHVDFMAGLDEIELAYALAHAFWGQGLATEMARALLPIAFGPIGLRRLACIALVEHAASRRVMEKVGFAFEREVEGHGHRHALYARAAPA